MEVFILHILKLNIIAAVVILLVKVLATLFKGRVSARWKYFIWLLITISLCVPVRLPENLALVDFKVLRSSQQNTQNPKITDYAVRPEESQKITETVSSASNDMKNLTEIPEQKRTVRYESDKWLGIVAVIFVVVWPSVAVLKLTGELLAYYFSIRNLERMSLQVSDTVSIQMYRAACQKKHVRRIPELRQNAGLTTPLLAGLLHTKLYLPATGYSAEERKLIFYHELTHYKKHDIFWNYIACLTVCIHWYCPWIRTVFRKNDEWSEVICDLSAIGYVGSAKHYFTTIFEMSQKSQGIKAYRAACLFESQDSLEQRIYYAMMYRKQKKIKYAAVIAMTVIFCGMSVTSTLAASKGYQKAYTKWVQETEVEIEEPDDEEEERISYEEKTGVLGNDKSESIKKINLKKFKKMNTMTFKNQIKNGKRLRYKGLVAKQNENIELTIGSQKKCKYIKAGIMDSQNKVRYIQDRGTDLIRYQFRIKEGGKYDVFIEMEGMKKMKISGMIAIND